MNARKTITCVIGTRPEAIKMAPAILALKREEWARVVVVATAQHRHMLDEALEVFGITPDHDLNLMSPNQTLATITARAMTGFDQVLVADRPDMVLGQGDTTTAMVSAMAAFYRQIPFGHVEAGLRTHDMLNPFPEEFNRVVISKAASLHFAPTKSAQDNLLKEGLPPAAISITGNTVIDALEIARHKAGDLPISIPSGQRLVLVTVHRRESFGVEVENICTAIQALVDGNSDVEILWPVHPNPNVADVVKTRFAMRARVHLCAPLSYLSFVAAMQAADFILTDSGGVQEEAPHLSKPVLVLRRTTERPEAVDFGVAKLIGTEANTIIAEANRLITDRRHYASMARGSSPYGDGHAAGRIVGLIRQALLPA